MRKTLEDDAKLLYTDTDSLIYLIQNVNVYAVMKQHLSKFDTRIISQTIF